MAVLKWERQQVSHMMTFLEQEQWVGYLMRRLQSYHPTTFDHSLRVAYLSLMMGRAFTMSAKEQEVLFRSACLHDIGKLLIPVEILDKKEKLSSEEWSSIRNHTQNGADLLKTTPDDKVDIDVILYHHENIDKTGYPLKRGSDKLSLSVRIVRVIDSFDAMTSVRAYNQRKTVAEALLDLYEHAGTWFDLDVVCKLDEFLADGSIYFKI